MLSANALTVRAGVIGQAVCQTGGWHLRPLHPERSEYLLSY